MKMEISMNNSATHKVNQAGLDNLQSDLHLPGEFSLSLRSVLVSTKYWEK